MPARISLNKFSDQVISMVMGWGRGYHGYAFTDISDGSVFGPQGRAGYIDMMHAPMHYHYIADDRKIPLAALLRNPGDWCTYNYDLGDGWNHILEVESVSSDPDFPIELLAGAMSCPPEDSNGLQGKGTRSYAEFLETYRANPRSKEMRSAVQEAQNSVNYQQDWLGRSYPFKPLKFDLTRHQELLKAAVRGPTVSKPGMLGSGTFKESYSGGCAVCGDRMHKVLKCSACKSVSYCGKEHQRQHWKAGHKHQCKLLRAKKVAHKENKKKKKT